VARVAVAKPAAAEDVTAVDLAHAGRRRRRWPWILMVIALLVGVAAGGVYAKNNVFLPSHPVPNLAGKTEAEARRIVAADNLKLVVVNREFNEATQAGQILSQTPRTGGTIKEKKSIEVVVSRGPPPVAIPDLTGKTEAEATELLTGAGLKVKVTERPFSETEPKGKVKDWSPKGEAPKGSEVGVAVWGGPEPRTISQDWAGHPYPEVETALKNAGLVPKRVDVYSDVQPTVGNVVSTSPGKGAKVDKGGTVTVQVSKGPETIAMPNVVGKNLQAAIKELEDVGLVVSVEGKYRGRVVASDPSPGAPVKRGSVVRLATL
jgi:serine/threonine-protein kinase